MVQSYQMNKAKSNIVREYILNKAAQTDKIVYSPPLHVANQLTGQAGGKVSKLYVVRMYAKLNIKFEDGLWLQKRSEQ